MYRSNLPHTGWGEEMTDFVISEERLKRMLSHPSFTIYEDVKKRPLSDELKKERNKLVVEMLSAIPNEGMPVWEERGYLKFINSFRSEE